MKALNRKPWVVFGEALIDKFPNAIVTGGAPFNVARHLASLGAGVQFVTRLGADAYGETLRAEMTKLGMSLSFVQTDKEHTTGTVRVDQAADGSHEFHILANQAYDYIEAEQLVDLNRPAQLYHGTLCLRSSASRRAWKALCSKGLSPRFVDMNWREGHLTHDAAIAALYGADMLKLSVDELALVLGWQGKTSAVLAKPPEHGSHNRALEELMSALAVRTLIVTYGAEGSAVFERGICLAQAPSAKLAKLVDTVGAGDAFSAVCMLAPAHSWDWPTTVARASDFAAAICGVRGAMPDENTHNAFYENWRQLWQLAT